jgi:hypothetical protein
MITKAILCIATLSLIACGDADTQNESASAQNESARAVTIPSSLFVAARPADADDLGKVMVAAKQGDTVRFLGRVGGMREPFVKDSSIFVVADPGLVSCELMGDEDHCAIPWDYCCEDRDRLRTGRATVRFIDDAGRPYRMSAEGAGSLAGSKFVLVEGIVQDKNDEGLFIVDASSVWVGGSPTRADHRGGSK